MNLKIEFEYRSTLKNMDRFEEDIRKDLERVIMTNTTSARKQLQSMLRPHQNSGQMFRSIKQRIAKVKRFEVPRDDRKLFRTVKPRGHAGSASNFFDRRGTKTTPALNWRHEVRGTLASGFESDVENTLKNNRREL